MYVWDWEKHTLKQKLELGAEGLIPLEVREAHMYRDPHIYMCLHGGSKAVCD